MRELGNIQKQLLRFIVVPRFDGIVPFGMEGIALDEDGGHHPFTVFREGRFGRMSDIKLFRVNSGKVDELVGTTDTIEKSVQIFFEKNLEALLGVRFLASEFTTSNGGRIDTLGLNENGCPVILEYFQLERIGSPNGMRKLLTQPEN